MTITSVEPAVGSVREDSGKKAVSWKLAQSHPVLTFLLITFTWTWLFWMAAVPLQSQNKLLVYALVLVGGYGSAIGGILTLGLRKGLTLDLSPKRLLVAALVFVVILGLISIRYLVGNIPGYDPLPENLTLSIPILAVVLAVCLVGSWAISSARSTLPDIREKMATILPFQLKFGWTFLALFFFAGMLLVSWGSSTLLGQQIEYPGLWGRSAVEVLPLFLLSFGLTALARGGMEEPGWRGMLLPELQKKHSPLVASLIIAVAWSLWHLPLYLNGFYSDPLVGGMVGGFVYRILLSIFLTWFYNRSGGNLLLIICLHTSFNLVVNFIPSSDLVTLVLWLVVVAAVIWKDKMYRRTLPTVGVLRQEDTASNKLCSIKPLNLTEGK